jgi:RepB DNA-primase from phage plasmid
VSDAARIDVEDVKSRVDLAQASAYFTALTGEVDPVVTFQTFSDRKPISPPPGWRDPLARVLHETLSQCAAELARLNDEGAGIFVMVAAGDLKGRAAENVKAVRAVFIDKDRTLLRPCSLLPTFAVFTSHEKGHAYWKIRGELPLDRFRAVQKRLIAFYGSDPSVHDLCRVMRVPGFLHRKKDPVLVTFEMGSGEAYTEAEILAAHPPVLVPRATLPVLPRAVNRSASADDEEIARDLVRDVADRRPWAEGSRHDSAVAVATYARKVGMGEDEIRAFISDRLLAAGKTKDEADAVVAWAAAEVAPIAGERERVVEIERRRREREERQRKWTR